MRCLRASRPRAPIHPSNRSLVVTSLGLVLFAVLGSVLSFLPGTAVYPLPAAILVVAFILIERPREALAAVTSAVILVAPIAVYLYVVWVLVVDRLPTASIFMASDGMTTTQFVTGIAVRLALVVALLQAALGPALRHSPIAFVRGLTLLPTDVKSMLVMTVSLASTMRACSERAWTSLVAARILSPRMSVKNLRNLHVLLVTIWMSVIGTVMNRIAHKWPVEDMRHRLDELMEPASGPSVSGRDALWLGVTAIAAGISIATR